VDDLVAGFSKWPENTLTSPSGRHLGHYRALLYDTTETGADGDDDTQESRPLFRILQRMINIPLLTSLPPSRWLSATSVCIEKEPNNPSTDKIRIIHLFEADLNFVWKILWGKRLVRRAEHNQLYPEEQYGSRPSRSATTAVLSKVLIGNYCQVTRLNLGWLDNDCTANYDRIICSLCSVACQHLGMPKTAEEFHNNTLHQMRYTVKTGFGISIHTYGSEPANPVQGQGQGAGNTPSCRDVISTPIWNALHQVCPSCFTCQSADREDLIAFQGIGFVDDATNFLNDFGDLAMTEEVLSSSLQQLAQSWERLLHITGGALKPSKCFYYLMIWDWANGFPILRSKQKSHTALFIFRASHTPWASPPSLLKMPTTSKSMLSLPFSPHWELIATWTVRSSSVQPHTEASI